jgi:hypothetical protein
MGPGDLPHRAVVGLPGGGADPGPSFILVPYLTATKRVKKLVIFKIKTGCI